jgi:hypothetical protein
MTVQAQARQPRGDNHAKPQYAKEHKRAAEPLDVARPRGTGQVPHLFHREQASLGQAGRSPDQDD